MLAENLLFVASGLPCLSDARQGSPDTTVSQSEKTNQTIKELETLSNFLGVKQTYVKPQKLSESNRPVMAVSCF